MTPPPDLDQLIADVREQAASDQALDLLAAAAAARDTLTDTAEAVLDHFVEIARGAGCSWTEIGDALGVSKQAAQQRQASRAATLRRMFERLRDPGLFRRFASEARDAIVAARLMAGELGHHHVGTEHLLLGLLATTGTAAEATLRAVGVTAEAARDAVLARAPADTSTSGRIQFDPRAKKVLELALRESIRQRSDHIGTEHLLLGMLREGKGLGVEVLVALGAEPDAVRDELARRSDPEA